MKSGSKILGEDQKEKILNLLTIHLLVTGVENQKAVRSNRSVFPLIIVYISATDKTNIPFEVKIALDRFPINSIRLSISMNHENSAGLRC